MFNIFRKFQFPFKFQKIQINLLKYSKFNTFSTKALNLFTEIEPFKTNFKPLTINILKYMEHNQEIYNRLCEESLAISYQIGEENSDLLKNELVRLNKQINKFTKENNLYEEFSSYIRDIISYNQMLLEAQELNDSDLITTTKEQIKDIFKALEALESEIIEYFIPDEDAEIDLVTMEVKSAAGGSEGALFAEDLFNMYKQYANNMGWRIDVQSFTNDFSIGKGCKSATVVFKGEGAYKYFKYESGVHKVQRVPITEKHGRVHSSTCQIAIFTDQNFEFKDIDERDLKIEYTRAQGAGGQHVNKTESAVRIVHLPTGIVVQNQDERDQHKNKAKALMVLRERIKSAQLTSFKDNINEKRKSQMGQGNLSEKIRTYNWPDSRVTDHRIGLTLFGIDQMLSGEHLETILDKLIENDRLIKLNEILEKIKNI